MRDLAIAILAALCLFMAYEARQQPVEKPIAATVLISDRYGLRVAQVNIISLTYRDGGTEKVLDLDIETE